MTNEEAIEYLKRADVTVGSEVKTKMAEALEMAITALSAEQTDSVLEDIKAEILKEINNHSYFSNSQKGLAIAYKIIDKHISGKEEE